MKNDFCFIIGNKVFKCILRLTVSRFINFPFYCGEFYGNRHPKIFVKKEGNFKNHNAFNIFNWVTDKKAFNIMFQIDRYDMSITYVMLYKGHRNTCSFLPSWRRKFISSTWWWWPRFFFIDFLKREWKYFVSKWNDITNLAVRYKYLWFHTFQYKINLQ